MMTYNYIVINRDGTKKILSLKSDLVDLSKFTGKRALHFITENPEMMDPLYNYLKIINEYLEDKGEHQIQVFLQEDTQEKDFKVLVIEIKMDFDSIDQEIEMNEHIGKLLDEYDKRDVCENKNESFDKLSSITFILEEND
ncbi:MAG: hypothetical protein Q8M92_10705 [Candidatus Subteraquimicrobiales bacterium]|nr:hypothetical protein [Candidatus Subteraquimicrobiales bacterium]